MKVRIAFRFTMLELAFLAVAFSVLAMGTWFSIQKNDGGWMPGVGAAVIVLGVVFALSDLRNLLALKADQFARLRKELAVHSAIDDLEEADHTTLDEEQRQIVRREVQRETDRRLPSAGPTIRKRIHAVEVFIVCLGTLVNGFGQKAVECWFL